VAVFCLCVCVSGVPACVMSGREPCLCVCVSGVPACVMSGRGSRPDITQAGECSNMHGAKLKVITHSYPILYSSLNTYNLILDDNQCVLLKLLLINKKNYQIK
jgi:hypothetical protein